jgi:hypothetical protein
MRSDGKLSTKEHTVKDDACQMKETIKVVVMT